MGQTVRTREELIDLLSPSLGREKAVQIVRAQCEALELSEDNFDHAAALQVLERVAAEPGLVGISARFLKSRLLLAG